MSFRAFRIYLFIVMLAFGGGCILYDSSDSRESKTRATAIAFAGCGPADGPALNMFIARDALTCSDYDAYLSRDRSGEPYIRLQLYGIREMDVGSVIAFGTSVETDPILSKGGWAGRCTNLLDCEVVETGTITFIERIDAEHVRIAVELTFEDGSTTSVTSIARRCERAYLCG